MNVGGTKMSTTDFSNKEVIQTIISKYKQGKSLRAIAIDYNTDHHRISRILLKHGIQLRVKSTKKCANKYLSKRVAQYGNMLNHLRYRDELTLDWLMQFKDFNKLKFLNHQIINKDKTRFLEDVNWYKSFILKFYFDEQFNKLYNKYLQTNDKYLKPSLDHIIPRSQGGTNELSNLRFLTYLENMCKRDIPDNDWKNIKDRIQEYFYYDKT